VSKVKICGLSREEDIETVNRVLPDYIGFIFAQSIRRVDLRTAAVLKEKLDSRIVSVGVFVNENIDIIAETYKSRIIDLVQLHGDENGSYIKQLKDICGCRVIKAVRVGNALPPLPIEPDYLIFDAQSDRRGGAGKTFEWNILKNYSGTPYFLAGGLSPENVADVIHMLAPFCVDVSSGVEKDGKKDSGKIERFVYSVRRIGQ
jgi:phosphoribosylanthranilate isomerase